MNTLLLGELIETLKPFNPSLPVSFDGVVPVGEFISWRGDYAQLSLTSSDEEYPSTCIVGDLLQQAILCLGKTFTGYKGGEFQMWSFTEVYADEYGECPGREIVGVKAQHHGRDRARLILVTTTL